MASEAVQLLHTKYHIFSSPLGTLGLIGVEQMLG